MLYCVGARSTHSSLAERAPTTTGALKGTAGTLRALRLQGIYLPTYLMQVLLGVRVHGVLIRRVQHRRRVPAIAVPNGTRQIYQRVLEGARNRIPVATATVTQPAGTGPLGLAIAYGCCSVALIVRTYSSFSAAPVRVSHTVPGRTSARASPGSRRRRFELVCLFVPLFVQLFVCSVVCLFRCLFSCLFVPLFVCSVVCFSAAEPASVLCLLLLRSDANLCFSASLSISCQNNVRCGISCLAYCFVQIPRRMGH